MKSVKYLIAFLAVCLLAAPAFADMMIKNHTHTDAFEMMGQKQPAKDDTTIVWIGDGVARYDMSDTASFIMNQADETIYAINHKKKTYTEIKMGENAMPDMDEMTKDMDPEQAAMMKKMMGEKMGGMMQMDVTVTPTEETKKIKDWNTTKYVVEIQSAAGPIVSDNWTTEDIDIDYGLFNAVSMAFMSSMPGYEKIAAEMQKMKGVPVYSETTAKMMGSEIHTNTTLLEYMSADPPEGAYGIPKGYKKVKM